ncbi:MAG: FAD-binding oxidoreductase [Ignavibacteriaceae bacterium]
MLDETVVNQLKSVFRGEIILPGDSQYETARKVYNGMIDRRPAIITKCADVPDVINAVNFGRDNKLLIAVRSGGHNAGGLGVCDDGLVIDLSKLKFTHVDPDEQTVRVGAGCTWGDVDHATNGFGFVTPSGIISTTGVGGLTLGGGIGHLSRKFGLTIDNLIEADIVLASGKLVKVNKDSKPDLYWAIRGGGGNFGVVTSFLFRLNKLSNVFAGVTLWELDRAAEVMKWYRKFIKNAPEDINGFFAFMMVPPGDPFPKDLHFKRMGGIIWCYTGSEKKANDVFKPIRDLKPDFEFLGTMPHPMLQSMFDPLLPSGMQWYWKADFANELSDEAIEMHIKYARELPTLLSLMHMYPVNGAAARPGKKDTAWSYRDATWAVVICGVDPDPANKDLITKWTKDYYNAIHPYTAGGSYVNFLMHDEGLERVKTTYRGNYDRLAKIKQKYDPENLFRVNQNIVSATKAA